MLSLLANVVAYFQWPKIRKEIRRLMPKTLALAERMENDLVTAVDEIGNGAVGVDVHYVNVRDGELLASLSQLKMFMEQCARKSLGMSCSKEFKERFSEILLGELVNNIEEVCDEVLLERQTDACIPHPFITRSPSFFITGNTIKNPWFTLVPGREAPKMLNT